MNAICLTEEITLACEKDLDRLLEIYEIAKAYMRKSGNTKQWNGAYPDRETLLEDIARERLYVYKAEGEIHGVFVLLLEEEPTYRYIEGGSWLNDEPYGTIHRIASDGAVKGLVAMARDFGRNFIDELRIDTHHDNHTMQHVVTKNGFKRCGIIYLENGDPRIAYQWSEEQKHENV